MLGLLKGRLETANGNASGNDRLANGNAYGRNPRLCGLGMMSRSFVVGSIVSGNVNDPSLHYHDYAHAHDLEEMILHHAGANVYFVAEHWQHANGPSAFHQNRLVGTVYALPGMLLGAPKLHQIQSFHRRQVQTECLR